MPVFFFKPEKLALILPKGGSKQPPLLQFGRRIRMMKCNGSRNPGPTWFSSLLVMRVAGGSKG
jgi:hypothetical protein